MSLVLTATFGLFVLGGQAAKVQQPITWMSIEHTPCYLQCPVYSVILLPDGTLRYHGEMYVPRMGYYTARIDPVYFRDFVKAIAKHSFWSLKNFYGDLGTDIPKTIIRVSNGKQTKKITVGPAPAPAWESETPSWLTSLDQSIDRAVLTATGWKKERAH